MKLTDEQLDKVADRLEGQCLLDLAAALNEQGIDETAIDEELCEQVESRVFLCDQCGWWANADELNNETDQQLCDQCAAEGE